MHRRLMDYTNGHNLLNENQGGFRPGHSTIETVNELVDDIALNINNLEDTLVTFIDFKKAFDTVDHQILINKLDRIGIKGKNLLWLKSYLANRSQATTANNIISDRRQITCGVPQGSILGPYMFLIYINDLSNSLKLSSVKFYADDTALYLKGTKPELLRQQMEVELRTMSDWCTTNKLTINPQKTKAMYFPAKRKAKDFKPPLIGLNNAMLDYVDHYKYLGVVLDRQLNFSLHLSQVHKLVAHKIYLLNKIRNMVMTQGALSIYKSKILPYFDYGDILYHNSDIRNITKLQRLQNRALRICLKVEARTPVRTLHKLANLPELRTRRTAHIRTYAYKRSKNPNYVMENYRPTRANEATQLKSWRARNNKVSNSPHNTCAREWNSLDPISRNLPTLEEFKLSQKKWLKSTIPIT